MKTTAAIIRRRPTLATISKREIVFTNVTGSNLGRASARSFATPAASCTPWPPCCVAWLSMSAIRVCLPRGRARPVVDDNRVLELVRVVGLTVLNRLCKEAATRAVEVRDHLAHLLHVRPAARQRQRH